MKKTPRTPKFRGICIFILSLMPLLLLTACPNPTDRPADGIDPENILEIPPLGTGFTYEGQEIIWSVQPHPRILARPEGISELRSNPDNELRITLLGAADMFRQAAMNDPAFFEASAPLTWAWGYVITGDESYLDLVRGTIPALLQFPTMVKAPEGANIPFLYQAMALGGVYDLLYNDLTEEEKAQIEKVLIETVFQTLAYKVTEYDSDINFWANDPHANYYVTFHSTAGLVAIVLAGVHPDAEKLAEHCLLRIMDSMDVFADDNGWREGLTYLDFCWGQFACYFFLALERNSETAPFMHPWFAKSIPWTLWGELPDRATIACFGDNEPENYSVSSWLYRVGAIVDDDRYRNEARAAEVPLSETGAPDEMRHLALDLPIFDAMCLGREPDYRPGLILETYRAETTHFYAPGLEWGFIRTAPEAAMRVYEDDFYCAFKSGVSGYDHNHLDQGSMILAAYGEVLLSDPGRGGPDVIRQDPYLNCLFEAGLGHNTLIVGDGCYTDLRLFPDNPEYFSKPGSVSSVVETEDFIQFTTNNSGLYPTGNLGDFRRTFLYIKPGIIDGADLGALVIADRVVFSEPVEHSFLFHTPGEVELIETGTARLLNGGARLDYYGFCTMPTVDKSERQETTWDIRDSSCYYRSTDGPQPASDWIHVLVPARLDSPGTPAPEFEMFSLGTMVLWEDYEVTLMLKPVEGWVILDIPME